MEPSEVVRNAIKARGLTQSEIAELLGSTQPALSRTLRTPLINTQSLWPQILDFLDLEIYVRPKGNDCV